MQLLLYVLSYLVDFPTLAFVNIAVALFICLTVPQKSTSPERGEKAYAVELITNCIIHNTVLL